MSDRFYTPNGSNLRIPYAAPSSTDGLLQEQPKPTRFTSPRPGSIRPILETGAIRSMSAGHEGTFRERVGRFVPSERQALLKRMRQAQDRNNAIMSQGESNRVMPDRGSFSSDKKKRTVRASYSRGDVVVHMAGHKRLTVMGPSRSKPGFYKAVDSDGRTYRVSPENIKMLGD